MKTLQQIFSDNPELLKDKSLQELIAYCEQNHKEVAKLAEEYKEFKDFVFDKVMHSEHILKDGTSSKKTLALIANEILNRH